NLRAPLQSSGSENSWIALLQESLVQLSYLSMVPSERIEGYFALILVSRRQTFHAKSRHRLYHLNRRFDCNVSCRDRAKELLAFARQSGLGTTIMHGRPLERTCSGVRAAHTHMLTEVPDHRRPSF